MIKFWSTRRAEYREIADDDRVTNHSRSIKVVFLTMALLLVTGTWSFLQLRSSPTKFELLTMELTKEDPKVAVQKKTAEAATAAAERLHGCKGIDWQKACERISSAGARRLATTVELNLVEDYLLDSDDPSVTYDENCLRVYRLDLYGNITFPYHANQLLRTGGNQTMALFIQHGAMRDADHYFCSFRNLMLEQGYRPFHDILVIAPDFNFKNDPGVLPTDAFWNSTKPWGDWRVGAESDPECCGNGDNTHGGHTISSFAVLDHMLGLLTDKQLYPNIDKISYVGHSAGGQMVQRYAILSQLAEKHDMGFPYGPLQVDIEFIVANPSSYTYLDARRWKYSCGNCLCDSMNCTCDKDCTDQTVGELAIPNQAGVGSDWICYDKNYNKWPYGPDGYHDPTHSAPYVRQSRNASSAVQAYKHRDVVYMVGQNDTCNDGLPTCSSDCWKRDDYLPEEWPCFRNHMDIRCPAMMEGPFRRQRGVAYMKYLEQLYGEEMTHVLHIIPGVGHNATAMFGSPIGMEELFD